jgi:hypothetical protein
MPSETQRAHLSRNFVRQLLQRALVPDKERMVKNILEIQNFSFRGDDCSAHYSLSNHCARLQPTGVRKKRR